jgi:hypothetical protein
MESLVCTERLDEPIPVEQEPDPSPRTSKRVLDCIYVTEDSPSSSDEGEDEQETGASLEVPDNMQDLMESLECTTVQQQPLQSSPLEKLRNTMLPDMRVRDYLYGRHVHGRLERAWLEPRIFVWLDDELAPLTRCPFPGRARWRSVATEVFVWFHHPELRTRRVVMACAGLPPGEIFLHLCVLLKAWRQGEGLSIAEALRNKHAALVERWQALWMFPYAVEAPPRLAPTHVPAAPQQLYFVRFDLEFLGDYVALSTESAKTQAILEILPLECEPRAYGMCGLPLPC